MQKTLAILIGLIAGVALVIVFLSCLAKLCDRKGNIHISSNLNLITDQYISLNLILFQIDYIAGGGK